MVLSNIEMNKLKSSKVELSSELSLQNPTLNYRLRRQFELYSRSLLLLAKLSPISFDWKLLKGSFSSWASFYNSCDQRYAKDVGLIPYLPAGRSQTVEPLLVDTEHNLAT